VRAVGFTEGSGRATCVWLGRGVCPEIEYAAEERAERCDVADHHTKGGFGVAPDEDVSKAICGTLLEVRIGR